MRRIFFTSLIIQLFAVANAQIVADHSVVDHYAVIPQQYIDSVKKMLVSLPGESHSEGYRLGHRLLEQMDSIFQVETYVGSPSAATDAFLRLGMHRYGGEYLFFSESRIEQIKGEIDDQNGSGNPFHVMGFGWCYDMTKDNDPGGIEDTVYQVRWAGRSVEGPDGNMRWGLDSGDSALTGNRVSMNNYLEAVESWNLHCKQNSYPTRWIFTTGPVDSPNHEANENGFQREIKHDYIREFVSLDSSRILFDYADILCWNNEGEKNLALWADEDSLRPHAHIHPDNMMDYDEIWNLVPHEENGDHIGDVGTLRLAKAMWWLLARMAGWDGKTPATCKLNFHPANNWIAEEAYLAADTSAGKISIEYVEFQYSKDSLDWFPVPGPDSWEGKDTLASDGWGLTFHSKNTPVHGTLNDSTVWIRVRACDRLGNISEWDLSDSFGIDNTPPSFSSHVNTSPLLPGSASLLQSITDSLSGILDTEIHPIFYIQWNDSTLSDSICSDTLYGNWNGSRYQASFEISDSLVSDTLYWRVHTRDLAGNISLSRVYSGGVVQGLENDGPTFANFDDDGDQPPGYYSFSVDISDPDSVVENADFPRLYFRYNTPVIDADFFDGYLNIARLSDSTFSDSLNISNEQVGDYIFWRVLALNKSNPPDSSWSPIQNGGRILSPPPPNHVPADIYLSSDSVEENSPVGSIIGILTTSDEDQDDTHSYELVAGPGDDDNSSFLIYQDSALLSSAVFDFETKASRSIRMRSLDSAGDSCIRVLQINIVDVNEAPQSDSVSIQPNIPDLNSELWLSYVYSDPEYDTESGTLIHWYKDGMHQLELDNANPLAATNTSSGEEWYAVVQVSDGLLFGEPDTSSIVEVSDPPLPVCLDDTLRDGTGSLSDNSGVAEYLNHADCQKLIQPVGADFITLSFIEFDIEANYDYVRIYDGPSISDPLLATLTGTSLPDPITSSGGSMLVHFTSDYSVTRSGWSAEYTSGELEPVCLNQTFTLASGMVDDNTGTKDYMNNADCQKLIQPDGASSITLIFTEFQLENGNDFVRIYDGTSPLDPLLGEFTGNDLPEEINSSDGSILIHFTSNDSIRAPGWMASYSSNAPSCGACLEETFTDASGAISDNSCEENYLNDMDCRKLIQPPGADFITLNFSDFNIENNYDFVRVYDGISISDPLLGEFTGNSIPPTVSSSGGSMLIHFTTDYSVSRPGWRAEYTSASEEPVCMNETFTTASGLVDDNTGLEDYMNHADCQKLIQPVGADEIVLTFTEFQLENGNDYVRVYDGSSNSDPLLGEFTGSTMPGQLISSGGSILIHFISNDSLTASGWMATYISNAPDCGPCLDETYTQATGEISDNSCEGDYLIDSDCRKLIQPADADFITLSFRDFITERNYDFVRVYDGSTTSDPLLGEFSGNTIPPVLTSSSGSLLIHFTSDYSITASGWSAEYVSGSVEPICVDETYTSWTGTLDDNSGTENYMDLADCQKLIQPLGADEITLAFTSFELEEGNDFVRIYDGSSTSDPLLGQYTGSSLPEPISSTGGSMLIHFSSNESITLSGWNATYSASGSTVCGPCLDEVFTVESDILSDNSCEAEYQNNTDCRKLIQPVGANNISLAFSEFNLESGYDFVRIYDGANTSAPLLGEFSGRSIPGVITSTGGSMLIHFTSDASITASGWEASYMINTTGCGPCTDAFLTESSGVLSDNSCGGNYENFTDCQKLIEPIGADFITLTFTEFDLESGYDFVRIYDGNNVEAPLLGEFSGNALPGTLNSTGGSMLVHFISDYSITRTGWSAEYQAGTGSSNNGSSNHEDFLLSTPQIDVPSNEFALYPNPSNGKFTIQSKQALKKELCLMILDPSGKILMQKMMNSGGKEIREEIDLSNQPAGIYFIQLYTDSYRQVKKLVLY